MPTLTVLRGLPGSGKTEIARRASQWRMVRVNRDDLRMMLFGRPVGLTFAQENQVTQVEQDAARAALRAGQDVIVDDINLRPKYVREWRKLALKEGAEFRIYEMPVDVDLCVARDFQRAARGDRLVGAEVIREMARKFLPGGKYLPIPDEAEPEGLLPYVADPTKLNAIIVDIDGTVALKGDRDIYDYSKVHLDIPNEKVIKVVQNLSRNLDGGVVIFLSGRKMECYLETYGWLGDHVLGGLQADHMLIMRSDDDNRRDSIVKAELFDQHVRNHYNAWCAFDDRDQVVEMWRSIGLLCLQVAPGNF